MAASFIAAYLECSPPIQEVIRETVAIVNSDDCDPDDVDLALNTLVEALFPAEAAEMCKADEAMFNSPEFQQAAGELEREHEMFAERVAALMQARSMTQAQLAQAVGISQPAVSNILNRNARPQRRTIEKFAAALSVGPEELWPTDENSIPV